MVVKGCTMSDNPDSLQAVECSIQILIGPRNVGGIEIWQTRNRWATCDEERSQVLHHLMKSCLVSVVKRGNNKLVIADPQARHETLQKAYGAKMAEFFFRSTLSVSTHIRIVK